VLSAPIVAVEVFRSSALVHRRGRLNGPAAGDGLTVELRGLPVGLLDSSLRVSLDASGAPRVVDLHAALQLEAPPAGAAVPEQEELRRLRHQLHHLEQRRSALARLADELMRLHPAMPPAPQERGEERFAVPDPVPAWLALGDFVRERAARALDEVRRQERELAEVGEQLRVAQERLARLSSEARRALAISKRLRVRLSAAPAEGTELSVSYLVAGARWYPSYELRVAGNGRSAELTMAALIAQSTGEDWPGAVELSLSTADLQRRADLPELGAFRIGRVRPRDRRSAWRALPTDLPGLFADYDRERPPPVAAPPSAGVELPGRGLIGVQPASTPTQIMARPQFPEDAARGFASDEHTPPSTLEWDEHTASSLADVAGELSLDEPAARPSSLDDLRTTREEGEEDEGFISEEVPAEVARAVVAMATEASGVLRGKAPGEMPPAPVQLAAQIAELTAEPWPDSSLTRHDADAAPSAQAAPSDELCAYGELILAGPDEADRGALRLPRPIEQLPDEWRDSPEATSSLGLTDFHRARSLTELEGLALPAGVVPVWESAGHFAYRYRSSLPTPVPADGQLHRLSVLRTPAAAQTVYRTVPLRDPAVYRLATLANPLDQPLLAGPLDVFWERDFLVTAQLQTTAARAPIEANLGVEPRLKVARNVRHAQREGGLLGGRTLHDEEIAIDVESQLPHELTLEVIERLPVSEDRKLEIKLVEENPPAEAYEQKERGLPIRGGRRFRVKLAPGGRGRCLLAYQLALPAKNEIVGGGRRA
jgi:hypothetical protein